MPEGRTPEIGIIGAGLSGICAGIQLQRKLGIDSFTLFEQNSEVGGTWWQHSYPGCACDVASHLYSFSFELNPNWTTNYPSQAEILEYLKTLAKKYDLYRRIKFQHSVKSATWNEKEMKWVVVYVNTSLQDPKEEQRKFDILINAPGALRVPFIPKEFTAFEGPKMHSAEWNHDIDIKGKRVAVIGSGASAIQIIPSIVEDVKILHSYQRKPPYVLPRFQFDFPTIIQKLFFYVPFFMWLYRTLIFLQHEFMHKAFQPGTFLQKLAHSESDRYRRYTLPDREDLWKPLKPSYSFGCKRTIVSEQYYPAMAHPNVKLHTSHVDKIVGQTIYTKDGDSQEIDVMILATGYRVHDYFDPLQVYGKKGENLGESWKTDEPRSYYGIANSAAPNHFALLGPNTGLGHNSIVFMIECQMNFILMAIEEMKKRNARFINLNVAAEDEWMDSIKEDMKTTVWGKEGCGSWYANSQNKITTLWPKNCISYWRETKSVDWSKFEFR